MKRQGKHQLVLACPKHHQDSKLTARRSSNPSKLRIATRSLWRVCFLRLVALCLVSSETVKSLVWVPSFGGSPTHLLSGSVKKSLNFLFTSTTVIQKVSSPGTQEVRPITDFWTCQLTNLRLRWGQRIWGMVPW